MGHCSSKPSTSSGLIRNQHHSEESPAHAEVLAMAAGERSEKSDFDYFLEVINSGVTMAKEKFEHFDALWKEYRELKTLNEQVMKENESLRQRYAEEIFDL